MKASLSGQLQGCFAELVRVVPETAPGVGHSDGIRRALTWPALAENWRNRDALGSRAYAQPERPKDRVARPHNPFVMHDRPRSSPASDLWRVRARLGPSTMRTLTRQSGRGCGVKRIGTTRSLSDARRASRLLPPVGPYAPGPWAVMPSLVAVSGAGRAARSGESGAPSACEMVPTTLDSKHAIGRGAKGD